MTGRHIPEEVIDAILYEEARCDLEYADNFRAYRVSDEFLKKEFFESKSQGCCGEFESNYIDLSGEKWIIGCNYGH
mgnify:CR=1 FL=1|jgi:hypothetical protein